MLGHPKHIKEREVLFGGRKSIIYLCKLKTKGEVADKMLTLKGRRITLSNAYPVLSVISFYPQLPDHLMSDHSIPFKAFYHHQELSCLYVALLLIICLPHAI